MNRHQLLSELRDNLATGLEVRVRKILDELRAHGVAAPTTYDLGFKITHIDRREHMIHVEARIDETRRTASLADITLGPDLALLARELVVTWVYRLQTNRGNHGKDQ